MAAASQWGAAETWWGSGRGAREVEGVRVGRRPPSIAVAAGSGSAAALPGPIGDARAAAATCGGAADAGGGGEGASTVLQHCAPFSSLVFGGGGDTGASTTGLGALDQLPKGADVVPPSLDLRISVVLWR